MSRQVTAFRLLVESSIAKRFGQATIGMKAAQIALHLKSVLAAALINPNFVLANISSGKALSLQIGKLRGHQRPVLLAVFCNDPQERDSLRRLLLALTSEVAGLVGGPVLPDASSVLRALLSEWLKISKLNRHDGQQAHVGSKAGLDSTISRTSRSTKLRRKSRASGKSRARRRKSYKWAANAERTLPHPDYPDVSAVPVDWFPGRKGRPPVGATRNRNGSWKIPNGFRLIGGRVHPPLELFRDAASVRETRRKAGKQGRRRRTKKAVQERKKLSAAASEAAILPKATPEPAEKPTLNLPAEQSSPPEPETRTETGPTDPLGEPP